MQIKLTGIQDMELFERHGAPVEERMFAQQKEALDEVIRRWEAKKADYTKRSADSFYREGGRAGVSVYRRKN